ncbi:hypothetical protein HYDPIDRAFT_178060 [Hydnomerulius pinastri MD-312]|uniref:Tc1-like transposase DDE domain-containing protein n=1 Tax=Hydnomerulius pinastri MD-312 TaxID=994086 RepID=A0A0C9UZP5_9AGAM|nr:hypothetical protein HYDPIDRAFT_178060 [Hydnomerulius pinastri MD-312]
MWPTMDLRSWAKAFILDRDDLPFDLFGTSKLSKIDNDELASELHAHLQSVGKYVKAASLVQYLSDPLVQKRFGMTSTISLATAKRWMHTLGYRWLRDHRGQYVDGHERTDVVKYRQDTFIPAMLKNEQYLQKWEKDGITSNLTLSPGKRQVEEWFHDEVTFYANDRRHSGWKHIDAGSDPRPKGEGASIMVSDFISADRGWCRSPDGKESAQVLFRTGKSRDGWFTNEDILEQTSRTMDLLEKHYPNSDHVLIFDNATTHLKRAKGAISARHMPKGTKEWGVDKVVKDVAGKPVCGPDGKVMKMKLPMEDARFADGSTQPLYFPPGHEHAGKFKGMAVLLKERGFKVDKLKAQCTGFKCKEGATNCCCRRILFNEPDFVNVPTLLETLCMERGFRVLILPKFHCELNFIEQCWGYAKRLYRLYPATKKDIEMEANVLKALKAVPIECMRRFANRSRRFLDAYRRGLNGKQAAWANKKYLCELYLNW